MSARANTPLAPDDIAGIHNILASQFTDRYINRFHASAVLYGSRYDPASELSNYHRTWWSAEPRAYSEQVGNLVLSGLFGKSPNTMERLFYQPARQLSGQVARRLQERPVMAISGHSPDLVAVFPLFGLAKALADDQPGERRPYLHDMFRLSHVVATRGFVPMKIGRRGLQPITPDSWTLLRAARLVLNPHFTFPRTRLMRESGIPEEFIADYNARARRDCLETVQQPITHPAGFHQLWAMAPGAGPDLKGDNVPASWKDHLTEMPNLQVTQAVGHGTIELVKAMGCNLLPVMTSFADRPILQFGEMVPADQITDSTLPSIMADLAVFRRTHGEPHIFYQEETV